MKVNCKIEQTASAWMWRALLGPAMMIDGLLSTLTLGTLSMGTSLKISRRLAIARFDGLKRNPPNGQAQRPATREERTTDEHDQA